MEHSDDCHWNEHDEDGLRYGCNCPAQAEQRAIYRQESELRTILGRAERAVIEEAKAFVHQQPRSTSGLVMAVEGLERTKAAYNDFHDKHMKPRY